MLPREPLRYLLADDPGAGKTIMAGLFCKELMIRGDVERCLVIAPGSLVDQWQVQEAFVQDKDVVVLVATDAAGEGINLQRAHLMVNHDLPWSPNRIEQRFGPSTQSARPRSVTCGTWWPRTPGRARSSSGSSPSSTSSARPWATRSSTFRRYGAFQRKGEVSARPPHVLSAMHRLG